MNQLQIGKDMRVELQIPPSFNPYFKATQENLRLGGVIYLFLGLAVKFLFWYGILAWLEWKI